MKNSSIRAIVTAAAMMFIMVTPLACKTNPVNSVNGQEDEKRETDLQPPKASAEEEALVNKIKDIYICPNVNMSIKDAEEQGALCKQGADLVSVVRRIKRGAATDDDIMDLIRNYKNQGRALVQSSGQETCAVPDKLKLDFFVMSYCPYGVKFVDETLTPLIDEFSSTLEWEPHYILGRNDDGSLASLHGQKEVDEDLRQICILEKLGKETWLAYTSCFSVEIMTPLMNHTTPRDWSYCADQAKIDKEKLDICIKNEAVSLADKDMVLSNKYQVGSSPTAVYNCSNSIMGAMPYSMVKPHLCKMVSGKKPETCVTN